MLNLALSVVHSDVLGTAAPHQRISEKAVWSHARGEGSGQSSTEDVMSGRVGGVVESSCMSYSDKADSDDYTMAAALVFLFSCWFWRRRTFLFLKFPDYSNQLVESLVYVHTHFG